MEASAQTCYHCGDDLPRQSAIEDGHPFCCNGCLTAYRIIRDAGRGEYYENRTEFAPRPRDSREAAYRVFEQSRTRNADGTLTAVFLIEGIHCASCVWINEVVLREIPGVLSAEVRLSTGRAYLTWNPDAVALTRIAQATARIGYRLVPLDRTGEPEAMERSRSLLRRMVVAGFFAGNMMLLSVALYAGYFDGMDRYTKNALHLLSFVFALPVLLYSAQPVFRGGWAAIRHRTPTMDLLTSLGISIAFVYSVQAALSEGREVFFDSITFVVFVLLIGRFIEERLKSRMLFFVENLAPARTRTVARLTGSDWDEVDVESIRPGDRLRVQAGEFVPVDGRLLSDAAETDTAVLTGEFRPQRRQRGETIVSGSRVVGTDIELVALSDAQSSVLAHITRMADNSLRAEPRFVRVAERASRWFIAFVLVAGAATFAYWWGQGTALAVVHTVTLLIAACPCALNLSVPTVYTTALQRAFSEGCLVNGGTLLETLAHVDTIVFDKTGTLTEGRLELSRVLVPDGASLEPALAMARALQRAAHVRHPVAEAFLRDSEHAQGGGANTQRAENPAVVSVEFVPGRGLRGFIDDRELLLGSETFLRESGVDTATLPTAEPDGPAGVRGSAVEPDESKTAHVEVFLAQKSPAGAFAALARFDLADRLRPEAMEVARQLRQQTHLAMLSGDSRHNAQAVSETLHLDEFRAPVTPEEKSAWIRERQKEGRTVAMVGDGINDSPSLRAADCGISFSGAADASVVRADIVLVDADLRRLLGLFQLARAAQRKIRQNLAFSFLYNALLLPLAFLGFILPVVGAVFMGLSSLTVLLNSLALRKVRRTASFTSAS